MLSLPPDFFGARKPCRIAREKRLQKRLLFFTRRCQLLSLRKLHAARLLVGRNADFFAQVRNFRRCLLCRFVRPIQLPQHFFQPGQLLPCFQRLRFERMQFPLTVGNFSLVAAVGAQIPPELAQCLLGGIEVVHVVRVVDQIGKLCAH